VPGDFDSRHFRNALGYFPTGVSVVTTRSPGGQPIGVTANSFASLSLDPPLILWSLARAASTFTTFSEAPSFAVNVLAVDQRRLSAQFARRGSDRFANVEVEEAVEGTILIKGCVARFQCTLARVHDGGDHLIFIGQVTGFDYDPGKAPLVFYRGTYPELDNER
jgi:3-hydroxy-9,10-secoandrosta-1,3,5(10)-triene-9,17-dione monooxygenase reductase component